jgi:hypothetical protein
MTLLQTARSFNVLQVWPAGDGDSHINGLMDDRAARERWGPPPGHLEGERTEGSGEARSGWEMGERPFQGPGSGGRKGKVFAPQRVERAVSHRPSPIEVFIPSPICPLAASRDAAPLQLVLVCASYEGRNRGLLEIRRPVPPAGRLGGIVRCGCNLSLAARMAYFMYVGGRMAKSAPPGARVRAARFLPADRPHLVPSFAVSPFSLSRLSCLFVFSFL